MTNNTHFLTIGVTGHRTLPDAGQAAAGVDRALRTLQDAYPGWQLCILSPLAEGADRLVVQLATRKYGAHYVAPLPLALEDYMQDFSSESSRREFLTLLAQASEVVMLPSQPSREEAYRATGHYILSHCDALIAVWDGQSARGQGGTAEIIAEARERRLPLAWVHVDVAPVGNENSAAFEIDRGAVSYERVPGAPPTLENSAPHTGTASADTER
jgi:hypothetical protein